MNRWNTRVTIGFLIVLVGALVAGGFGAFYFLVGMPQVGIITLEGSISTSRADRLAQELRYAEEERNIRAVVLRIDSPGGSVAPVEDIYANVLRLAKQKPLVVVMEEVAASGGYFAALGANYIFAKPTSIVGNIGVILRLPEEELPSERELTTGPYKSQGASRAGYIRKTEVVKEGFVGAVIHQRGERLKASREELSKGEIYLGIEALELGLVDGIGTATDAMEKAAELARLVRYQVVDVRRELAAKEKSRYGATTPDLPLPVVSEASWPRYYYLVK
ncbi:MAG: S49 family peptidase [Chloroflexi bacterium]|nr:S49 family peptidase [Chloroflexota bacterium]